MDDSAHKAFFTRDRFAADIGIRVVSADEGSAVTEITVEQRHLNGMDIVQGGVLFTLADIAFAVAANSRGLLAVGLHASISWVRAARGGTLRATAREVSCTRRIGVYGVVVEDADGNTLATFEGTAYRKDTPWADLVTR